MLLFVYGSAVAIVPLLIAVPSILTTFLFVLGLTHLTDASFLAEYLLRISPTTTTERATVAADRVSR